jgi:acyl carrier protein
MDEIRRVVIEELTDLAPAFEGKIKDSDRIIADLKLTGDDASIFAMLAAKRLGIKVPLRAWRQVYTVGDAIETLRTHAASDVPGGGETN